MKSRSYRRYMEEIVVKRRLRNISGYYHWRHDDVNQIQHKNPSLNDFIGTDYNFKFKTYTTDIRDSKYKIKYSPNKCKMYETNDRKSRVSDKREFKKILEQYGLKHFNTE